MLGALWKWGAGLVGVGLIAIGFSLAVRDKKPYETQQNNAGRTYWSFIPKKLRDFLRM